jgi:hypothetical protein
VSEEDEEPTGEELLEPELVGERVEEELPEEE